MRPIFDKEKYTKSENQINRNQIQKKIEEILKSQLYGVLATSCNNQPYTSLLAFVASDDTRYIFLATGRTTYKFQNLTQNPKVAFFIDTRFNDNFDIGNAYAITAFGNAELIKKNRTKDIRGMYLAKHPHLESFIRSKNVQFIQIVVSSFALVEKFQNVFLLEINDGDNPSVN